MYNYSIITPTLLDSRQLENDMKCLLLEGIYKTGR